MFYLFIKKGKGEKMLNKRAVSPLIATVLLVMIVVSIGAAVMVVIQGLADEQIQSINTQADLLQCGSQIEVSLIEVDSVYRICKNVSSQTSGTIALLMQNTGQKDITGFRVDVLGDDGYNSTTYDTASLSKNELKGFRFNFGGVGDNSAELSKIMISPMFSASDTVTCKEPNLEFDKAFLDRLDDCTEVTWDNSITAS